MVHTIETLALFHRIAKQSSFPDRPERYISGLFDHCDDLTDFSFRGTARDGLRPSLHTVEFRQRALIAFAVHEHAVEVLCIYCGPDHENLLAAEAN